MHSKHRPSAGPQTLKEFWFGICAFYSTLCLVVLPSEAARLRCGSDLLTDLIFVCGDRGIYLGKGNWSGYGMRPRGKGIVDHCCRPAGCDLQHLEMYCAKSNSHGQRRTTASPTTMQPTAPQPTAPQPTALQPSAPQPSAPQPSAPQPQPIALQPPAPQPTALQPQPTAPQPTALQPQPTAPQPTAPQPTTPQPMAPQLVVAKQFQDVFQRRLLEHMGAPNSPKREAYRKKTHHSHRRKNKASSSRKRMSKQQPTSRPTPTSGYPKNNKTTTNFDLNMNLTEQG